MVLTELGNKITNALRKMADSTVINDDVLDEMLKEICNALVFNYLFLEKISNCFPTLSFSP
jgi:signal recognition particle GTPase